MDQLHITNGDIAAGILREAGIKGEILPWRDVLHEGPVPAGLSLDEMSQVRARFIADCGWAGFEAALADFRERDAVLATSNDRPEITLWFEHDLYDQLQLLQLLDWFAARPAGKAGLSMICVDEYLGRLSAARMAALYLTRQPIREAQLLLARQAWRAFCAPDPEAWQALLDEDTSALPFFSDAVLRHLEQFPSVGNGLNRTETALLDAVSSGVRGPGWIFEAAQREEEREFMGDSTFFLYVKAMFESTPPLLKTHDDAAFRLPGPDTPDEAFAGQQILLTEAGTRVLGNELDWMAIRGGEKWLGGVRLSGASVWRWDHDALSLQLAADGALHP